MAVPKSKKEWIAGLTSTVAGSILGGAFLVQHYGLGSWLADGYMGVAALAGVCFSAGLPFWVVVRAFFRYAEKNKSKGLVEIIKETRAAFKGDSNAP